MVTTSFDGRIRLYGGDLVGAVRPTKTAASPSGYQPYGVAFSPDGSRLAVAYSAVNLRAGPRLEILEGQDLTPSPAPGLYGVEDDLSSVAWSGDGTLLAAGGASDTRVFAWSGANGFNRRGNCCPVQDKVNSIVPLPDGDLLVATDAPSLARFAVDGTVRWAREKRTGADLKDSLQAVLVSRDGTRIDFGFAEFGHVNARFDLARRTLTLGPPPDAEIAASSQDLLILGSNAPTLHDGRPLPLQPDEGAHSLAIHPANDRFVVGASWSLVAIDANGTPLWRRPVPGTARAVNITGDGRLVVAAYGDGTIRWHRMSDGVELLAFMPLPDQTNWVAWTPEGFYAATPGTHGILRWHVNRGNDAPADSIPIEDIPGSFRPAVLPLVLQEMETPRALGLAMLAEHNKEVAIRTHSQLPPGVQLHLLTIGISAYNQDYATNLRLLYADRDAHDLASAIVTTQGGLYSHVTAQALTDKDANRVGIRRGLQALRTAMERGGGNDLAVVHISGHGALVDGRLYLLPQDTDARDAVGIKDTALAIDDLKAELVELAKHGRVLVLLDACHSGATTMGGTWLAMDATALRTGLAAANVTVLTSSRGDQKSREDARWGHRAFTQALLDALNDPAADTNRTGLINATGLANYVVGHVASLTEGKQTPDMEVRFGSTVFAVGM